MAFKPEPQQTDFSQLVVSLDNSKIQLNNYALYQTIFLLIQAVTRSRDLMLAQIEELEEDTAALDNVGYPIELGHSSL
jgi:hypothetical protein